MQFLNQHSKLVLYGVNKDREREKLWDTHCRSVCIHTQPAISFTPHHMGIITHTESEYRDNMYISS